MTENPDAKTQLLEAQLGQTRARVASDVQALAQQLQPEQLKERALDVAEHSAESLAWRLLGKLAKAPRSVTKYVGKHPAIGVAAVTGAALLAWRLVLRHRR